MNDILRYAAILTLVALITAGSLAWIDKITKPKIIAQQEKILAEALSTVLPTAAEKRIVPIKEKDVILYYKGYNQDEQLIGYAFLSEGKGYSSTIRTLVGIDTTGVIFNIKILSQQETPGLGSLCEELRSGESEPWWQQQFKNKRAVGLAVDKDNGEIESITGATITSRAVVNSIADRAAWLMDLLKKDEMNESTTLR